MTTWKKEIENALREYGESPQAIECCTLSGAELETEFDAGEGKPFFLWTKERVYFAVAYDDPALFDEWADELIDSFPRHPSNEKPWCVGGQWLKE